MQLTGIIIFIGSLLGFLLWLYRLWKQLGSTDTYVKRTLGGKITINIFPGVVLFIVMAISAGMAWG